jgi:hypothetical protein
MNQEFEIELVKKYPEILRDYRGDKMQTCMAWGMECNDGWYKILDHLLAYLTSLTKTDLIVKYTQEYRDSHKDDKDYYDKHYSLRMKAPQIILDQVKEKYGTLTVYYHANSEGLEELPEEVQKIIDKEDYDKKVKRFYNKVDFAISYAEFQSSITCEQTGKEGRLYTKGWCRTMCDEVAIEKGYDIEDGTKEGIKWEEY